MPNQTLIDFGEDLKQLESENKALKLRTENYDLKGQLDLQEKSKNHAELLIEAGDIFSRSDTGTFPDSPGFYPSGAGDTVIQSRPTLPSDREGGRDRPFIDIEHDLDIQRGIGRFLVKLDETSIGVLEALSNYTIGSGFQYSVSSKKGRDLPKGLEGRVQDMVDEFIERNDWTDLERELFQRGIRDGETIVHVPKRGPMQGMVSVIEPEWVVEPPNARQLDEFLGFDFLDWTFGIASLPGFPQNVVAYHIDKLGDNLDVHLIQADEVIHHRSNVDRGVKRGLSDYYAVFDKIDRREKILRNVGEGAALKAAIAWIKENPEGVTQGNASSSAKSRLETALNTRTLDGGTLIQNWVRYPPGSILNVPKGSTYKDGPMGNAAQLLSAAEAIARVMGVRWQLPEFMVSGDASNANFASTLIAEGPFVRATEHRQAVWGDFYKRIVWKSVELAGRSGAFQEFGISFHELRGLVDIEAQAPRIAVRNLMEESQRSALLNERGILSKETWASEEGLDWEQEQERGVETQEPRGAPISLVGQPQAGSPPSFMQSSDLAVEALSRTDSVESARRIMEALDSRYP